MKLTAKKTVVTIKAMTHENNNNRSVEGKKMTKRV